MTRRPDLRLVSGGLRASSPIRSTRLGPAFDLLAAYPGHGGFFFERDGEGVASGSGPGLDASVETAAADDPGSFAAPLLDRLRAIEGASGASPIVVGALPFSPSGVAHLQIPRRAIRKGEDGAAWLVDMTPSEDAGAGFAPGRVAGAFPHDAFTEVQVHERPEASAYESAVATAVMRILEGEMRKVVLARTLDVDARRELDPRALLHRLRAVDPHSYAFAAPIGPGASLVGASPELLVRRESNEVRSTPLAGSAPRSGDPEEDRGSADALAASAKEQEEHAIVVEAIAEVLDPRCERLDWDPEPRLLETANVWHLATRFRGVLRDPAPSALELVGELHPTPAVCGRPAGAARALIGELEPFDRGCYAGPVGWMDAAGDGEWAIALRCAELVGAGATLFAGAGIVADSEPERELEETERKFRAFLDSLRWG
ncbi:MAG TPA: isochorismate synthase [Actinomycetota bacterium]|nr:isochorismate synthase [Actinomycetota bacterium]